MSNDKVVSVLQEIGKRCRDSEQGYRKSSEDAQDFDLKSQFQRLAHERSEMADEIDRLLSQRGGEPVSREGSTLGQAHRMFVDLKSAVMGNNRQAILTEIARGESVAEASYDSALRADLPEDVRRVLQRQHDRVRETRDRYRALSGTSSSSMAEQVSNLGQRSAAQVQQYVEEQPLRSSLVAFGVGFLLGALIASAGFGTSSRGSHRYQ